MVNEFSTLNGAKYFSLGIFKKKLVYIEAKKYIKYFGGTFPIESWKYNRMSERKKLKITK